MPGIRIDSGVAEGSQVGIHYDPLLAKLIAGGATREAARRRAVAALRAFPVLGITTDLAMLIEILEHPRFIAGDLDTGFLHAEHERLVAPLRAPAPPEIARIAEAVRTAERGHASAHTRADAPDPWSSLSGVRVYG
jgi:propionyl-CoA carboxylase alpha chain